MTHFDAKFSQKSCYSTISQYKRFGSENVTYAQTTLQTLKFSENFLNFLGTATFQNSAELLQFSPKFISLFSSFNLEMYFWVTNFAHVFWNPLMKSYLMMLNSKNFDFKIMLSQEITLLK